MLWNAVALYLLAIVIALMELVSPVSTALSQVIKNMHPQGASASLSQSPHIPQGLTNMHTNTTAAHNYTNQHSFSLNITSSTTGPFNQSQEQAPASNHPVANPGGGQTFTQKSNNATPSSPAPVPVVASVEMPLPEKSQSNGTSEDAPPQLALLAGNSVAAKDKPTASESVQSSEAAAAEAKADAPVQAIPDKTEPVEDETSSKLDAEAESKDSPDEDEEKLELLPKAVKQVEVARAQTKPEPDCIKDIAATPDTDPLKTPIDLANQQAPKPQVVKSSRKVKASQEEPKAGTSMSKSTAQSTAKRQRLRTQHYQSPLPEVEFVSKISTSTAKSNDEKLMVFYKNEFLAVRNAEGGFYLCQTVQNIYKTSSKIKIRWLSQSKHDDKRDEYTPDFYDRIDFDCILTNLSLNKADKKKFILPTSEKTRTQSILNRSLAVEKGEEIAAPSLTAEHPDGLDLSLYRDEDQLKKRKSRKRPRKASPAAPQKDQPSSKKTPKAAKVKKPNPLPKRTVPAAKSETASSSKAVAPVSKPASKVSSKAGTKASVKSSPVVDQKKAKMIARIGRKAALAAASKSSSKSTSPKNGKSGKKAPAASNKAAQPKTSLSAKTTTRSLRKSSRK